MASFTTAVDDITDSEIWANTIIFTKQPSNSYDIFLPHSSEYNDNFVMNYSQLYDEYVTNNPDSEISARYEEKMALPTTICTGDVLQTSEYRGVGAYYAVWLHADSYKNPESWKLESAASINKKERHELPSSAKKFTPPFDVESFGLTEDVMLDIKQIFSKNQYTNWKALVESYIAEKGISNPLLTEMLEKNVFSLNSVFTCWQVHSSPTLDNDDSEDDEQHETAANEAWAELIDDEDWIDPSSGEVQEADKYVKKALKPVRHPLLRPRRILTTTLQQKPWMQLYLFQHSDEYGYAAPVAVSMAPDHYFPRDGSNRDIDITLLPPPVLSNTTFYGPIVSRMHASLKEATEDWDDEQTVAVFDFEAEDRVFWRTPDDVFDCGKPGEHSPVNITRRIFHTHAMLIREHMKKDLETAAGEGMAWLDSMKDRAVWFERLLLSC